MVGIIHAFFVICHADDYDARMRREKELRDREAKERDLAVREKEVELKAKERELNEREAKAGAGTSTPTLDTQPKDTVMEVKETPAA
jgi:hypothetical protein